jgi:hypothetical protein
MEQQRLDAIKARAEAATPGPWIAKTNRHPQCNGEPWGWISGAKENTTWSGRRGKANAEFIAHARTDIPDLIAEVERLEAELEATKQVNEGLRHIAESFADIEDYREYSANGVRVVLVNGEIQVQYSGADYGELEASCDEEEEE